MTARTRRPCRKPFPLAAVILFLTVISLIQPAQAQSLYIVDQFDPSGIDGYSYAAGQITNVWGNWFGDAFQSLSWDSTSDASNNPNSGSMKIIANFNGLGSIPNQFEVYDYIDSITPAPPGWVCTNFECDVRFAAGSATVTVNGTSTFGCLQFGTETAVYGQDYFGGITIPASNTNWVHVSIPLNVVADTNLLDIGDVLIHIYGPCYSPGLSGLTTLWVDNIAFTCAHLPPTNCVIDWKDVHQRIDGFGASSAWDGDWTTNQADLLFSTNVGAGLSLLRSRIAPDGTSMETSIMQWAQQRGARVWSTPWSPPAAFKDSTNVNGGDFLSQYYEPYAAQLANYVLNMKTNYGINLYAISLQNEPQVSTSYESCVWTAQQFHDFIPYVYSALAGNGVGNTKILFAESDVWSQSESCTSNAMSDPAVSNMVGIIASHDYDLTCFPLNNGAKPLWETEVSTGDPYDGGISNGVYWAGQIHDFMTIAQVNAWHYWWLIPYATDNESLVDTNGNPAKRLWTMGNFARFVRPGFYRIGVSNNSYTQVSAYRSTNSGSFAIVAINPGPDVTVQTFDLTNFTATSVTPWITSSNYSLASQSPLGVANIFFCYPLPAMSVVTFVGQGYVAPSSITISNAAFGSSGLVLTWNSCAGSSYSVLKANGAAPPISNWTAIVTNYPPGGAGNGWLSYTDTTVTTSGGPSFYRVRSP